MENEKSDQGTIKKLWSTVRIALLMLKRGKMASKAAIAYLMYSHRRHYSALTCRSDDIHSSLVTPCRHYKFSCSNTPRHPKRKKNRHAQEEPNIGQRVFDAMEIKCSSPMQNNRRLNHREEDQKDCHQVDKDAEEFIKMFYKDLMDQKRIAALESPSPYHTWTRR